MVKKYNDIIIFIDNYCYQPIEIESTSDESSDNENYIGIIVKNKCKISS